MKRQSWHFVSLILLLFSCLILLATLQDTEANSDSHSKKIEIKVDLHTYQITNPGICPAVFLIKANISVSAPTKVQYKFIRSDETIMPIQTLLFDEPGIKTVTSEWQLDKPYSGWVAIDIIYPQNITSKRSFKLYCGEAYSE
jgi:hypothetical protein